jgi:hypothetical protein
MQPEEIRRLGNPDNALCKCAIGLSFFLQYYSKVLLNQKN